MRLDCRFDRTRAATSTHVFYTGPLDAYFGYRPAGSATGRSISRTIRAEGDFQGTAVHELLRRRTCPTPGSPSTSISRPGKPRVEGTVCYREYSRLGGAEDIPYYPIRLVGEKISMLSAYVALAKKAPGISFLGRLGTYRYLDMDVTIREAMDAATATLERLQEGAAPPAFFLDPLG